VTSEPPDATPGERTVPVQQGSEPQHQARRGPRIGLIVAAGLIATMALVGSIALVLYDRATAIDRSTPAVVSDQYLRATLFDRDANEVAPFICAGWSADEALAEATKDVDPALLVSWGDFSIEQTGSTAVVTASVTFRASGAGVNLRDVESWNLRLQENDGWRVCGIDRQASLNP
jgi:hypothetical protein